MKALDKLNELTTRLDEQIEKNEKKEDFVHLKLKSQMRKAKILSKVRDFPKSDDIA